MPTKYMQTNRAHSSQSLSLEILLSTKSTKREIFSQQKIIKYWGSLICETSFLQAFKSSLCFIYNELGMVLPEA